MSLGNSAAHGLRTYPVELGANVFPAGRNMHIPLDIQQGNPVPPEVGKPLTESCERWNIKDVRERILHEILPHYSTPITPTPAIASRPDHNQPIGDGSRYARARYDRHQTVVILH
jgi:hypothetical protein